MGDTRPTGRLIASTAPDGNQVEVRLAGMPERQVAISLVQPDSIRSSNQGTSPPGEAGTLETVLILMEKLREAGQEWSEPTLAPPGMPYDAVADGPPGRVLFQVTRAIADPGFWHAIANGESVDQVRTFREMAAELSRAIDGKARRMVGREDLVLALNALETPEVALPHVVNEFRIHCRPAAKALNFREVWLVGPLAMMTFRLA